MGLGFFLKSQLRDFPDSYATLIWDALSVGIAKCAECGERGIL